MHSVQLTARLAGITDHVTPHGVHRGVARGVYRLPGKLGANQKVVQLQLDRDDSTMDSGTTWEYIDERAMEKASVDELETGFDSMMATLTDVCVMQRVVEAGEDTSPRALLTAGRDEFISWLYEVNELRHRSQRVPGFLIAESSAGTGSVTAPTLRQLVRPNKANGCPYQTPNPAWHRDHIEKCLYAKSGSRPFKCGQCSRAYKNGDGLRKHVRMHHEFVARTCGESGYPEPEKVFRNEAQLTAHFQRYHMVFKPRGCPVDGCPKQDSTFETCHGLNSHLGNYHTDLSTVSAKLSRPSRKVSKPR